MEYVYVIKGDPIAWKRAGVNHSRGIFYDRQKPDKIIWGIEIDRQHDGRPFLEGPLELTANFYFRIPKTRSKKRLELIDSYYDIDPDSDNLAGFIMDVCKSIVYHDDNLISQLVVRKLWADEPKIEFSFKELKGSKYVRNDANAG